MKSGKNYEHFNLQILQIVPDVLQGINKVHIFTSYFFKFGLIVPFHLCIDLTNDFPHDFMTKILHK
jgi:hypothetical protein